VVYALCDDDNQYRETQMTKQIDTFISEWTAAELAGDAEKLSDLLTEDFSGVGPLGFVLPRPAWLARHGQGLAYEAFDLDEIQVHHYGDVALVAARNNTRGTFWGQPVPEALRVTLVIPADSGTRRLAAIHMSFIAGTPGAPPMPAGANPPDRHAGPRQGDGDDSRHENAGDGQ
jgi:ketosteroid isomerase-like protein